MSDTASLSQTPLYDLHLALGARMVRFAGYAMPVQYSLGLMAEHKHTRESASLFDVSHMGQLMLSGSQVCQALETLIPMDVQGLGVGKQRYGLLLNAESGILDDLMFFKKSEDEIFVIVNGACKAKDIAHITSAIDHQCTITPLPALALLALQGPLAVQALSRILPGCEKLVFMAGGSFVCHIEGKSIDLFITRSGYTGEDGFEISVAAEDAPILANALLAQPEVKPAGLGARNSLRLEAGLCLYGNDLDVSSNPVEANLLWAIQKARRTGGDRAGGFPGAEKLLRLIDDQLAHGCKSGHRIRIGLIAAERVPVREHAELFNERDEKVGEVTSGLLSPSLDKPIAMAYVDGMYGGNGTKLYAKVRGKHIPMVVSAMPFVATKYYRG